WAAGEAGAARQRDGGPRWVAWRTCREDRAEQWGAWAGAAVDKRPPVPVPAEPVPLLPLLEALHQSVAAARAQPAPPPPAAGNGVAPPRRPKGKRPPARRRS